MWDIPHLRHRWWHHNDDPDHWLLLLTLQYDSMTVPKQWLRPLETLSMGWICYSLFASTDMGTYPHLASQKIIGLRLRVVLLCCMHATSPICGIKQAVTNNLCPRYLTLVQTLIFYVMRKSFSVWYDLRNMISEWKLLRANSLQPASDIIWHKKKKNLLVLVLSMAYHPDSINPLRANFFRGNRNIHLHFMSLLHIDMAQVLKIFPQIR